MFNPSRLEFARRRRGLTKKSLATKVGLSPRAISMFENKESAPSDATLKELANRLLFPLSFFHQEDDMDTLDESTVSFRSLSRMSAARKYSALNSGAIAILFNQWIEQRFSLPEPDLIEVEGSANPETTAMALRQHWEIGELSISNLVHLMEAKGIRVFSLAEDTADVDAFSLWKDGTPYVFLNTLKSSERSRFDAAHELGHLILHKHSVSATNSEEELESDQFTLATGPEVEREADQFASAFLMPASSIRASMTSIETIPSLIKAKKSWRVSLAALAYRTHKLGIITDWHYRTLCIGMSKNKYTKNEPESIPREQSKIWAMIFEHLRANNITKQDIAQDLDILPCEIEALVFGLILTDVSSENVSSNTKPKNMPSYLKLVD